MRIISKKRIYSKHLEKGRIYKHYDSNGGHPALIYYKNDKKNIYRALKFTHKDGASRTMLKHNIEPNDEGSTYVHNYPIEDKRNSFSSSKWNKNLSVHKEDKPLINFIKRKNK